ncbi:LysR family transcriptional regulator [Agrobacterium larrymoorei]|uniref:LysR family transcriptional regulator n=1 Tax=Agrobacterium larrymoorei TaxID=160699 RepID=UPI001F473A07|nr:LysR family transcriptional regulator [Agrobacterium larrymoorei]
MPSYDDLSVFLDICETEGFRSTAKRLGISPASVSERISRLEARLGVPLLTRTTRSVRPTQAGIALAERLNPLFSEARAALQDAASSQEDVRGLLRLNVPGAVMVDILPPLIEIFLKKHPQVRVEFVVEDRLVDATAAGCDAGIRYGEHLAQDMIAVPIGPSHQRSALAASPAYLEAKGIPAHPLELLKHDCIRLRFSSGAIIKWEFEKGDEALTVDPQGRLIVGVDAVATAIDFARSGHGLIYTFENWLTPHFESGALCPVLPDWWTQFDGPQLYFSNRFVPAPLRAFIDLLAAERAKTR